LKKIFTYKAFGLFISSEIEIPEFFQAKGEAQVRITFGKVPANISTIYKQGFRYQVSKTEFLLRFKEWAEFYVKDGKQIIIQPDEGVDERDIRAFLLSPVIALLLHQRGLFPLHSSGINYKNRAVLFAGNSGAGKSTIAVALNRKFHYPLISDDISVINNEKGKPVVFSSFPSVKLWDDSLEMLEMPIEEMPFIRRDVLKRKYDNSAEYHSGILDPAAIFFLSINDQNEVTTREIKGVEKFNFLRQYIFRKGMVDELYAKEHFSIMTSLLTNVNCFELKRPKSETLPDEILNKVGGILLKIVR
jgi:hypothetical protein